MDPCGPGGAIIGFWVPVRGPGEATDGSDAYTSIPGSGKGLMFRERPTYTVPSPPDDGDSLVRPETQIYAWSLSVLQLYALLTSLTVSF